jgi:hypothetical protein
MSASERPAPATGTGPSEDSAASVLFDVNPTRVSDDSVGQQFRRRRQASLRCEPLSDGRRDTFGGHRKPQPGRHLLVEVGKRTVWLRDGDRGDRVFALLDAAQVERRQWDSERRCWMVSVNRADDVLAYAEYAERWTVTCEAVQR